VKHLVFALVLASGARGAVPGDACELIPRSRIAPILGSTKNLVIGTAKLPSTVTESKACTYAGQENAATVIFIKFDSPASARDYLGTVRAGLEKKSIKTVSEKFDQSDGFSFASGMLAVKKNIVMRVNVRPRIPTEHGTVNPTLTRELLLAALQSN
jgi:hypothetical protein